jgi:F-type H+-transporting ATPase subunit c
MKMTINGPLGGIGVMKKSLVGLASFALVPALAFAEETAAVAASGSASSAAYWSAGVLMAVAVAMAAFSQSRAAVAALDGIARNPASAGKMLLPLLLPLALMESLVLFAFLIASNLAGK